MYLTRGKAATSSLTDPTKDTTPHTDKKNAIVTRTMKREKPAGLRSNDKIVKPSKKLKVRITSDDQSPSEAGQSKEANNTPVYPSGRVTRAKAGGETSEATKNISDDRSPSEAGQSKEANNTPVYPSGRVTRAKAGGETSEATKNISDDRSPSEAGQSKEANNTPVYPSGRVTRAKAGGETSEATKNISDDRSPSEAGQSKEANNTPVYPSRRVTRAKVGGKTSEATKSISNGKKTPGKREKAAELKSPVIKSTRKKGEISADNKGQKTLPEGDESGSTKTTTPDIAEEGMTLLMHLSGEYEPLNPEAETPQSFAPLSPETTGNQNTQMAAQQPLPMLTKENTFPPTREKAATSSLTDPTKDTTPHTDKQNAIVLRSMKRDKPAGLRSNDKIVKPSKKLKVRITSDDQSPSEAGQSKEANNTPVYPSGRVTRAKAGGETSEATKNISDDRSPSEAGQTKEANNTPVYPSGCVTRAKVGGKTSEATKSISNGKKTPGKQEKAAELRSPVITSARKKGEISADNKGQKTLPEGAKGTLQRLQEAVTLLMNLSGENNPLNPEAETPQSFAPLSPETTGNQEDTEANCDTTVRRETGRPDKIRRQAKLPETPLEFVKTHNQVAYLEKTEKGDGPHFHEIVDFLNTTHIRYALTINPTLYVSQITEFWQTATVITNEDGDIELHSNVDGISFIVTENSIRRHLKLEDSDGINDLPNTEIWQEIAKMGYDTSNHKLTFLKACFSPQWRFLIHILLHCLSPKRTSWEQFSSNIAIALICLSTNKVFNFSKFIFECMVNNVKSKTKFLMYPRFVQAFLNKKKNQLKKHKKTFPTPCLRKKLFQNMARAGRLFNGVVIPLFPEMLERIQNFQGERSVIPKFSGLVAGQGSVNITKTPTMATSDVPSPQRLATGDEGSSKLNELMELCTNLSNKVLSLEDELKSHKRNFALVYKKLVTRVKKLEAQTKRSKGKRSKLVISTTSSSSDSDDDDDSPKQGRKTRKTEPLIAPIPTTQEQDEMYVTVAQMKTVMSTAIAHVNEQIEKAVADQFKKYLASQHTTSQPTATSTQHPNASGPQHNYKDFELEELKKMMLAHMLDQPELRNAKPALFGYLNRGADLERTCTTNVLHKRLHDDLGSDNH